MEKMHIYTILRDSEGSRSRAQRLGEMKVERKE